MPARVAGAQGAAAGGARRRVGGLGAAACLSFHYKIQRWTILTFDVPSAAVAYPRCGTGAPLQFEADARPGAFVPCWTGP